MTLFPALLLACVDHQYLAIPGATAITAYPTFEFIDDAPLAWTLTSGDLAMAADQAVTLEISLDQARSFEVTEIVIVPWVSTNLMHAEYWVYEIQEEERAVKRVQLEARIVTQKPSPDGCSRWLNGTRVCYGTVDEGIEEVSLFASDGATSGLGAVVPLTLAPLEGEGEPDACEGFDLADCCEEAGVIVYECYVEPICGCPQGTTDLGTVSDGYRRCECPAR